ncbi:MAG: hypothetical protein NDI77_01980 [Geobacteraceae bacterium]|nr:hypothetical protein [Geobacteraceae bacterium]
MKRVCLLACCAVMSGCAHPATVEMKKEPLPVAGEQKQQEKPGPYVRKVKKQEISAALVEKTIIKGKTTKQEIVEKLGPPNGVSVNFRRPSKEEMSTNAEPSLNDRTAEFWNYWTAPPMEALKISGPIKIFRLTVCFDDNGVALDYQAGESTVDIP